MSKHEVWGFVIECSPLGKNIWPEELKREATRRIREEGIPLSQIADELRTKPGLVRKWWIADRRQRGDHIQVEVPAFATIQIEGANKPIAPVEIKSQTVSFARLHVGKIYFEFPSDIPEMDLLKLIRVAGRAT
ncbi:transposase [Rhizobium metallidurans]|uniref:Transposase-like protein n=1 Tax=Rhizobium metallidurans TaxID=1265931 RepID=A0A7W6CYX4_9HYPH|nr:transposase [Rhizobium metallidurans]MBB3965076.1 transposase-like protein [Rhizobium metallidurans]